jgi:hypothetical protein
MEMQRVESSCPDIMRIDPFELRALLFEELIPVAIVNLGVAAQNLPASSVSFSTV